MENVGCDRSETGNEPRLPRSAHQTPASGLQLLQCCTRTPAADGLRVSATNHKASPIPRGVHLKRARTTVASFSIFFSTRSNDDTRQRLAFSTPTHPPTISIRHPPPHRSQQTDDCRGPEIHVPCFSGFCRVLGRNRSRRMPGSGLWVDGLHARLQRGENTNQPINSDLWLPTA